MDGNVIGLVAVILTCGIPIAAMYTYFRVRHLKTEERLAAIARGVDVPMQPELSEGARSSCTATSRTGRAQRGDGVVERLLRGGRVAGRCGFILPEDADIVVADALLIPTSDSTLLINLENHPRGLRFRRSGGCAARPPSGRQRPPVHRDRGPRRWPPVADRPAGIFGSSG